MQLGGRGFISPTPYRAAATLMGLFGFEAAKSLTQVREVWIKLGEGQGVWIRPKSPRSVPPSSPSQSLHRPTLHTPRLPKPLGWSFLALSGQLRAFTSHCSADS